MSGVRAMCMKRSFSARLEPKYETCASEWSVDLYARTSVVYMTGIRTVRLCKEDRDKYGINIPTVLCEKWCDKNDQVFFLGRVIKRTVRGYSVAANPKYIRDVIAVLGLEEAKPVVTPSVKRTPTTESLAELENERRAVCRTAVGKLLYMCQERADIKNSVKETARKIICPTESDEMNVKRFVRYLKGASSAKCLIEIVTTPKFANVCTDSDWAGQPMTCKSTSGGVVQW